MIVEITRKVRVSAITEADRLEIDRLQSAAKVAKLELRAFQSTLRKRPAVFLEKTYAQVKTSGTDEPTIRIGAYDPYPLRQARQWIRNQAIAKIRSRCLAN